MCDEITKKASYLSKLFINYVKLNSLFVCDYKNHRWDEHGTFVVFIYLQIYVNGYLYFCQRLSVHQYLPGLCLIINIGRVYISKSYSFRQKQFKCVINREIHAGYLVSEH